MDTFVLKEFDLTARKVEVPKTPENSFGYRLEVELTEHATGKKASNWYFGISAPTSVYLVHRLILKEFPQSKAAERIRNDLGAAPMTLRQDWEANFGECVHTALRKLCDGSASALWWNLLSDMPGLLRGQLWKSGAAAIAAIPADQLTYGRAAKALKEAWSLTLDQASSIEFTRLRSSDHMLGLTQHGWPMEALEELHRREEVAFKSMAKIAYLSLGYLSKEDWRGMVSYLPKDE